MEHEHTAAHSLVVFLTQIAQDMERVFLNQVGVSVTRMELLHEVWHAGEIRQTELTKRLSIDGSLLTRFVKQMEADKLITRRADPKDNRFALVSLVPAGLAELEKMQTLGDEFQRQLLAGLSEMEVTTMLHALQRMQENLEAAE